MSRSAVVLTLGGILAILGGSHGRSLRTRVISPGALASPHAAIRDCAACHTAEADAATATRADHRTPCLTCHQAAGEDVRRAHSLSSESLGEITRRIAARRPDRGGGTMVGSGLERLGYRPPTSPSEPNCAMCHREHGGRGARLTMPPDGACQPCHVLRFAGFARGHPDFLVYGRVARVDYGFEHEKHEVEHFPKEERTFACRDCHGEDRAAGSMTLRRFEDMCLACHGDQITRDALPVFRLPGVDYKVLQAEGISIGEWPLDAGLDLEQGLVSSDLSSLWAI